MSDDEKMRQRIQESFALKKAMLGLFAQYHPAVVDLALADAVALRMAQYPELMQLTFMEKHIENVLRLIPTNQQVISKTKATKAN